MNPNYYETKLILENDLHILNDIAVILNKKKKNYFIKIYN